MRIGLDTNVLVYAIDTEAREKHRSAVRIVRDVFSSPEKYLVSSQVLAELLYVAKRKRQAVPLATKLVVALIQSVRVISYGPLEVVQALTTPRRYFWDRLLAYTYLNHGAAAVITEDEKPYKGITDTINPFKE